MEGKAHQESDLMELFRNSRATPNSAGTELTTDSSLSV